MEKISAVLATTHVDLHNEAFALSALEGMVEQLNRTYLPIGVEHDPRIPPIGRVLSAEVRKREDGEFEIAAELEIFEEGDRLEVGHEERQTIVNFHTEDRVVVVDDRSLLNEDDQRLLGEIRGLLDALHRTEGKKSVDPITVLTIAASVLGDRIIDGFLGQIGGDAWEATKNKLKEVFKRKRNSPAQLLNLAATVQIDGAMRLIEVFLSDPADADLDALRPGVVDEAIGVATRALESNPFLVRFVFTYSGTNGLRREFAVAINGAPVLFEAAAPGRRRIDRLSLGGGGEIEEE